MIREPNTYATHTHRPYLLVLKEPQNTSKLRRLLVSDSPDYGRNDAHSMARFHTFWIDANDVSRTPYSSIDAIPRRGDTAEFLKGAVGAKAGDSS